MPRLNTQEQRILAAGLFALSLSSGVWAGASAWLAVDHMARIGAICGVAAVHCGWCVSAVAGGVAAVLAAMSAIRLLSRPTPVAGRIGARRSS